MNISAIIPAYNSAEFIADAVRSILMQTHPVLEIIVVDDGSTDATAEIVVNLPGPIKYIKQQNQGPSAARNTGIKAAGGDWIAFLDADDQWTTDKIEKQINLLKTYPSLALIAGDMTEIDHEDRIITQSVLAKHNLLEKFQHLNGKAIPNALSELVTKNFIPTGTVLVNKTTLIEAGLFNQTIRFGEDLELWARIATKYPISCIPEILMLRRQHGNNATQMTAALLDDLVKVMQSIKKTASQELKAQRINPARLVADAYASLGYWHFDNLNLFNARKAFSASLRQKPNKRALFYWLFCYLSPQMIATMRKIKNL
ncbi:glycosyltransferase family 2 protein [Methylomicrobium sp. RS1]|jgi:glycosyltransferase involved in cell wall biosynthesis|uniref:glycosyltransferase family 2 protein n=1 Tax=Candidatus Methylomicrobium oryzae TaxID=2802053 RepID=UPI001922E5E4|nr:glycosyltransferase family 2 protein [Methylomicrobium sp. RS1]MBL1265000.1 glycosyltransferase family 2 protein [Methylomicrobium sp. RS1]